MSTSPDRASPRRQFRFNWKMTAFTVALLPLLISLGYWQLDREQEKLAAQDRYDRRLHQDPVDINTVDWTDADLGWTQIRAQGHFMPDTQFLLDNRISDSRVGYEVITPFRTQQGTLLVNRGWIEQGATRAELPDIDIAPTPDSQIVGHIYVPSGETLVLGADNLSASEWPKLIQRVDPGTLSGVLGYEVFPYIVRLTQDSPGVLKTNWSAVNMQPEVHRGYAIQWFMMAAALIILYLVFSFRKLES